MDISRKSDTFVDHSHHGLKIANAHGRNSNTLYNKVLPSIAGKMIHTLPCRIENVEGS